MAHKVGISPEGKNEKTEIGLCLYGNRANSVKLHPEKKERPEAVKSLRPFL